MGWYTKKRGTSKGAQTRQGLTSPLSCKFQKVKVPSKDPAVLKVSLHNSKILSEVDGSSLSKNPLWIIVANGLVHTKKRGWATSKGAQTCQGLTSPLSCKFRKVKFPSKDPAVLKVHDTR